MIGETNLATLLRSMKPQLNDGDYVFCSLHDAGEIKATDIICSFTEKEGISLIVKKDLADKLNLSYSFVAAWITLTIHSSLEAIGLTAAFSNALSKEGISCNVVAAYYHDHIFVAKGDAERAVKILEKFSEA